MECTTNNRIIVTKGENFEVKQVEPSRKCIDDRTNALAAIGNDTKVMEIATIDKEIENTTGKKKTELEEKRKKLEADVDFSEPNRVMQATNRALLIGSIKGNFFEAGYFRVGGKDIDITDENISMLPNAVYNELLKNAEKLIEISEAEEKN